MGIFSRNELNKAIQEASGLKNFVIHQKIKELKRMADDAIKSKSVERMEFVRKRATHLLYECEKGSSERGKIQEIIDKLNDTISKLKSVLTTEDQSKIKKEMKNIVAKYNNDDKIKERIKKDTSVFYKFTCKVFEEGRYSISFYISEQDSDYILSVVGDIINEMANELKKILNDDTLRIHTGDGDEGCIFIEKVK